jgi:hypothetical protein
MPCFAAAQWRFPGDHATILAIPNLARVAMRLVCYPTSGEPPCIVPAPVERGWMDRMDNGFAYRCLPLNIANAHGWLILNPVPFVAEWNGGSGLDSVSVRPLSGAMPVIASSHFGAGVLTFNVNGLFRTEPGFDLMITGPFNQPKDAIQPLTGVVETDWAPFTFTMNWKFTRKRTPVAFEKDEAFCMIFPVKRGLVDEVAPEIRRIEDETEVHRAYTDWAASRLVFNEGLRVPGSAAREAGWQKDYFRGGTRFGESPPDHRTKLKPRPFVAVTR